MKFDVTADKMVMIDGKIITIKAGKLDTTDKALIAALGTCKGVSQAKRKKAD